jgi:hypothetical protein
MGGSRVSGYVFLFLALAIGQSNSSRALDDQLYAHVFVVIEENHGYGQIIGNPRAPNLNRLAETYGLATRFYAEVHPSEANYVAVIGGDTFGINDDDAYYCLSGTSDPLCAGSGQQNYVQHTIRARSLIDQLAEHELSWKGYFESIPAPGSKAAVSIASDSPGQSQPDQLYVAKHNGFINFASVQHDSHLVDKLVGFDQLTQDLSSGKLPNYAHVIPNECNDMHGLGGPNVPPDCGYDNDPGLIARGDNEIGRLIGEIQASPAWSAPGNFAVVITWDEDNHSHPPREGGPVQGCCGDDPKSAANYGGGHIATIVITNHGPRGVKDDTPYNHYSLLRTTEDAFGIAEHLHSADDAAHGVVPMTRLFWK